MNPKISVVMPVHNEDKILLENLGRLIAYLESRGETFEIVLVENGSTDKTLIQANEYAEKDDRVKALSIAKKSLGDALRKGFQEARGDIIIWYPIDLAIDLSYIKESLDDIKDCDLVIGSKEHKDSKVERSKSRKRYSMFYNSLVNLFFNLGLSDTQCVKTLRKDKILPLLAQTKSGGIVFEVELLYLAKKKGLRLKETPVTVKDFRSDSKIKYKDIRRAFTDLIVLRLKVR
jgi:glycosyltransferase involved in cell wall biosynthesis